MFEEGGYPIVDVGDAQHIAVVDEKQGQYLIRQVERLDRKKLPPVLMSDVALEGELLRILSDPHIGRLKDRRGSRLYDRLAIVC